MINTNSTPMTMPIGVAKQSMHKPIEKWIEMPVRPEVVWKIISTPSNLKSYHPIVKMNEAQHWDANLATDMLRYFNDLTLYRQVYHWLEGEGYDLDIGQSLGAPNGLVSWRISSLEAWGCCFKISQYLDGIVKGLLHLAGTGDAVVEDQFGKVDGFSNFSVL